jgi:hypothetical protein
MIRATEEEKREKREDERSREQQDYQRYQVSIVVLGIFKVHSLVHADGACSTRFKQTGD